MSRKPMKDGSRLLFVDTPGAGAPLVEPFAGGGGAEDIFTAPAPPEAGLGKYDPSCGVVLNIQGFGVGRSMSDPGTLEKPSAKKFCGYARSPKQHLESASA